MMGPDCGTAIIGGTPLAFANVMPRGDIGLVAASGTGLQEISTLLARNGRGVSHAIGVGGRDLKGAVGGLMTLAAIDALDRDPDTRQIVLISKPPEAAVAERVLERVSRSAKPFSICFIGAGDMAVPSNARLYSDLRSAAEGALGDRRIEWPSRAAPRTNSRAGRIEGLYTGGTLCAEAQVFFRNAGAGVVSNVPIPGIERADTSLKNGHVLLDLGDDEYTVGRPHPMIDPSGPDELLRKTPRGSAGGGGPLRRRHRLRRPCRSRWTRRIRHADVSAQPSFCDRFRNGYRGGYAGALPADCHPAESGRAPGAIQHPRRGARRCLAPGLSSSWIRSDNCHHAFLSKSGATLRIPTTSAALPTSRRISRPAPHRHYCRWPSLAMS